MVLIYWQAAFLVRRFRLPENSLVMKMIEICSQKPCALLENVILKRFCWKMCGDFLIPSSRITEKRSNPNWIVWAINANGKTTVDNVGTKPFTVDGRTMIPVRSCMEKFGAKVTYVSDSQPIVIVYNDMRLELKLNSKIMKLTQGNKVTNITIDVPAQKINGKSYLPLRAVSQAFGFDVYYDSATKYIIINSEKMNAALKNERLAEGKNIIK